MSCFQFLPCFPKTTRRKTSSTRRTGPPSGGVAFDVLLTESTVAAPKPMLLASSARHHSEKNALKQVGTLLKEDVAEKARARNESRQEVAARVQKQREEKLAFRRLELERDLVRAAENREHVLAEISGKACQHLKKIKSKVEGRQSSQAKDIARLRERLEDSLARGDGQHEAGVARREAKARRHNQRVAETTQRQSQKEKDRISQLQKQLQKEVAHFADSRAQHAINHNKLVAQKVIKHIEETESRMKKLREKVEARPVRTTTVNSRRARAAHHNHLVRTKVQRHLEQTKQRRNRILKKLQPADAVGKADAVRSAKASTHNANVAKRTQLRREQLRKRTERLQEQVQAKQRKTGDSQKSGGALFAQRQVRAGRHNTNVAAKALKQAQLAKQHADNLRAKIQEREARAAGRRASRATFKTQQRSHKEASSSQ